MCDAYDTTLPAEFAGMDRFVARKAIVAKFDELGLLVEVKDHDLVAPYGDRSGVIIEPLLTDQWYVRVEKLAGPAVDAVKDGQIEFVPKQYENMYFAWMNNIQDWCISRQLWWGHRIPAWYDDMVKYMLGVLKQKYVLITRLLPMLSYAKTMMYLILGSHLRFGRSQH